MNSARENRAEFPLFAVLTVRGGGLTGSPPFSAPGETMKSKGATRRPHAALAGEAMLIARVSSEIPG